MSNKPFDLEKALAGEPILTRDRQKGFVKFVIENDKNNIERLVGVVHNGSVVEVEKWFPGGNVLTDDTAPNDIIGMWQEPRPRVQLVLPAPLETVAKGQEVYYLELGNQFSQISSFNFNEDNPCAFQLYKNGGLFATKEDAQEWLNAMRNARR